MWTVLLGGCTFWKIYYGIFQNSVIKQNSHSSYLIVFSHSSFSSSLSNLLSSAVPPTKLINNILSTDKFIDKVTDCDRHLRSLTASSSPSVCCHFNWPVNKWLVHTDHSYYLSRYLFAHFRCKLFTFSGTLCGFCSPLFLLLLRARIQIAAIVCLHTLELISLLY